MIKHSIQINLVLSPAFAWEVLTPAIQLASLEHSLTHQVICYLNLTALKVKISYLLLNQEKLLNNRKIL